MNLSESKLRLELGQLGHLWQPFHPTKEEEFKVFLSVMFSLIKSDSIYIFLDYLTADIAKRIGEWDNRRNSAQQCKMNKNNIQISLLIIFLKNYYVIIANNNNKQCLLASLKHEDSFSQDFIKKMHEWEKKKAFGNLLKKYIRIQIPIYEIVNKN